MSTADTSRPEEQQQRRGGFWRHPLLWIIFGMLLGLAAAVLLLFLYPWKQETPKAVVTVTLPDEFRDIQRARLQSLQSERDRLLALLREDPCALPELLGLPPQKAQPDPSYGKEQTPPPGAGIPPKTPTVPSGNGTVPQTSTPAPQAGQPPATVADLMDSATVFIISMRGDGLVTGSGFFVAPGVVATNAHVVGTPTAKMFVGNKTLGGMQPARIIALSKDESRDYALLRVSDEAAAKVPVLRIAPSGKRTERVSAWGFPAFITNSDPKLKALLDGDSASTPEVVYSEGVISVVLEKKPPFIVHTAPLSQGNSGGPLINEKGVVVGINTMIAMAVKDSYSQSGVALPGEDLIRYMKENGINASPAE